jgi:hypothetical protein
MAQERTPHDQDTGDHRLTSKLSRRRAPHAPPSESQCIGFRQGGQPMAAERQQQLCIQGIL